MIVHPTRAQWCVERGVRGCVRAYAYVGHIRHFYHETISIDHTAHILE